MNWFCQFSNKKTEVQRNKDFHVKSQNSLTTFLPIKCRPISLHFIYKCVSPKLKSDAEERSFSKLDYHFPIINLFFHLTIHSKNIYWVFFREQTRDSDVFSSLSLLLKAHMLTGGENNNIYVVLITKCKMIWIACYFCKVIWPRPALNKKKEFIKLERRESCLLPESIIRAGGECCDPNMWETWGIYRTWKGNPLQYSCLENPMDRGAWWATIHGVTKSRTQLSEFCVCVCYRTWTECKGWDLKSG